jgi:prefoldin subunit 5
MAVGSNVATLLVSIGSDISSLEKGLSKAQRKLQDAGRSMKRVGGTLTRNVTAPLALIGGAAIKAAGDFESSFADIRKTVTATEPEFAQMSSEIRELAKTIPTSVNELNKLGGVAGQLGVEADNIVEFTKTMAMLGDTTDIAGEQAALSL